MNSFKGTLRLIRLAIRRDRVVLPLTILIAVGLVAGSAPALADVYGTYEEQLIYVSTSAPSIVGRIFQGTVQGPSLGTVLMAETYLFGAVILAIMSIFIITRHTRHNEETGAGELIGSLIVGKNAPLTASLIVAILANLITAFIIFITLLSVKQLDTYGSLIFSISLALVGIVFAGIASVTAQLSDYRRGANSIAIFLMGGFFLLRGFGDALGKISPDGLYVTPNWLSWLSPFGWGYQVLPYTQNNLILLFLILLLFVSSVVFGFYLLNKRDIGSGIFASRPGPKRAKNSLLSANGLAIRLQKGGLYLWLIGFAAMGVLIGVMSEEFKSAFEELEIAEQFFASTNSNDSITVIIVATMFTTLSSMAAGFVVSTISKMQSEEATGRLEYLFGTAVSRFKWMFSHVVFTLVGSLLIMLTIGLIAGISYTIVAETTEVSISQMLVAGLVNLPAIIVFLGMLLLLFSLKGRFVKSFGWGYFAYCVLIASLASIFKLPQFFVDLSPFTHTPSYPSSNIDVLPIIIMSLISIALIYVSFLFFKNRDLSLK